MIVDGEAADLGAFGETCRRLICAEDSMQQAIDDDLFDRLHAAEVQRLAQATTTGNPPLHDDRPLQATD